MKKNFAVAVLFFVAIAAMAQQKKQIFTTPDPLKKIQKAEISCGECKFKMKGEGCHLAVRMNGKNYWVGNADVESFGDAHDKKMGFCNKIRKAEIQGEIKNGKYALTYLKFLDK